MTVASILKVVKAAMRNYDFYREKYQKEVYEHERIGTPISADTSRRMVEAHDVIVSAFRDARRFNNLLAGAKIIHDGGGGVLVLEGDRRLAVAKGMEEPSSYLHPSVVSMGQVCDNLPDHIAALGNG